MGLGTNDRNFITRLKIGTRTDEKGKYHAVIGMRCKPETPGARPILKADGTHVSNSKTGELLYRLEFDFVSGNIIAMARAEDEWGKYLDVTISDGADTFALRLDRGDRYWTDFLMRLPTLDLSKSVTITPYNFKNDEGKTTQGVAMKQNGVKIERAWNKGNDYAGGPPQAEFDEDEQEWKFGKRNRWLDENVVDKVIATLGSVVNVAAKGAIADGAAQGEDDDLPF